LAFVDHTGTGQPQEEIPIWVSYGCPDPEKPPSLDCFWVSGGYVN